MQFEKGKSEIPTGKGKELNEARETLPAINVKHEVVWVNPDLDIPFDLEVGKPTNLGLFFSDKINDDKKQLEVRQNHKRSALLGRVILGEKNYNPKQQVFRDIDIKGLGYVYSFEGKEPTEFHIGKIRKGMESGGSYGILDFTNAQKDTEISEIFDGYGVRTPRVIAIIALKEIVENGEKISIEEARKRGLIAENINPVLEIRAFGTTTRLIDIMTTDKERQQLLLEDARLLVAQELGIEPSKFSITNYLKWLVSTTGKNIGLMQKNGWHHQNLSMGHNITLDGCVVDFDSVERKDPFIEESFDDHKWARTSLLRFMAKVLRVKNPEDSEEINILIKEFDVAYNQYKV